MRMFFYLYHEVDAFISPLILYLEHDEHYRSLLDAMKSVINVTVRRLGFNPGFTAGQVGGIIIRGIVVTRICSRRQYSKRVRGPVIDPLMNLQPFATEPILEDQERIFTPRNHELNQGELLFTPQKNQNIIFLKSAPRPEFAPNYLLPEVAFVGRSNVGKSSLIKAIFEKVPNLIVKTSKRPGHTKLVNFFQVGKLLTLVDMPGYGFRQPKDFVESTEAYLATRKNLCNTILLIDGCTGIKAVDMLAIEMLESFSLPYLIVLTKIDRLSKHSLLKCVFETRDIMREKTSFCLPQPFLVSSHTLDGVTLLKCFIGHTTGVLRSNEDGNDMSP